MTETTDPNTAAWAWLVPFAARNSYTHARLLPARPGTYAVLTRFIYTTAIIVGKVGDDYFVADRWCYHDQQDALEALEAWQGEGEPDGWHRHPNTGRRRPQGVASMEFVEP